MKIFDNFRPSDLIGKIIKGEHTDSMIKPYLFQIISIKKHYRAKSVHKGRCDLVVYETNNGEFSLEYKDVCSLVNNGICKGSFVEGYEFKIIN